MKEHVVILGFDVVDVLDVDDRHRARRANHDALERFVRATRGVVVPREAWDRAKVPAHLMPTFRVVDEQGRLRRHMRVFVDQEMVRDLDTSVDDAGEVTLMQALSGG